MFVTLGYLTQKEIIGKDSNNQVKQLILISVKDVLYNETGYQMPSDHVKRFFIKRLSHRVT